MHSVGFQAGALGPGARARGPAHGVFGARSPGPGPGAGARPPLFESSALLQTQRGIRTCLNQTGEGFLFGFTGWKKGLPGPGPRAPDPGPGPGVDLRVNHRVASPFPPLES